MRKLKTTYITWLVNIVNNLLVLDNAGRADSEVQGVITTEGLFDGVIRDGGEEFFIEPAHRYFADGAIHLYRDHSRDLETASEKQVAEDTGSDFQSKKKQYKNKYNATFSGTTTSSGDPIFHSVIYKVGLAHKTLVVL